MISPHVQRFLCEHLQGQRSSDETREILRLIDDSRALEAEFDSVLDAVAQKIPGLAIDFDKLLSGDEIECDPLISQGNLALLRLDAIYHQAFQAWTKSGGDLHTFKSTTTPENPTNYSDRIVKHERSDQNYPPDAQLLNQVVNITLSGFRIQATITHRRDQLKEATETGQPTGATQRSRSQPDASARDDAQSDLPPETDSYVIGPGESLADFDDFSDPIEGKFPLLIRGVNKIGILKGYDKIAPLTKTRPIAQFAPAKSPSTAGVRSEINLRTAPAEAPDQANPFASNASPCETHSVPAFSHGAGNANYVSQNPREEEPVISEFSVSSAPPRETSSLTSPFPPEPAYHKRE